MRHHCLAHHFVFTMVTLCYTQSRETAFLRILRGLRIAMNSPDVEAGSQRIDSYEHCIFAWPRLSCSSPPPLMPPSFPLFPSFSVYFPLFFSLPIFFLTGSCVFQARHFK